ncbi:MAG: hypothetical protein ACREOE_07925, partial [Gemmatimonadales bacterium]
DVSGPDARVVVADGPDLQAGMTLPPAMAAVVRSGQNTLSGTTISQDSHRLVLLAAASSVLPQRVALETSEIQPAHVTPNRSGPYSRVYVNLYGTPTARADSLLITTYGPRPLPKPVATATVKVGGVAWLIAV